MEMGIHNHINVSKSFYKELCLGDINVVKKNIKYAAKKCHLEISVLIIPTLNAEKYLSKCLDQISKTNF